MTDPQSNATLANIDFAVQQVRLHGASMPSSDVYPRPCTGQNAFILNFRTTGNPAATVAPLYARALASMEPLFSAYGWTDDEVRKEWECE